MMATYKTILTLVMLFGAGLMGHNDVISLGDQLIASILALIYQNV